MNTVPHSQGSHGSRNSSSLCQGSLAHSCENQEEEKEVDAESSYETLDMSSSNSLPLKFHNLKTALQAVDQMFNNGYGHSFHFL